MPREAELRARTDEDPAARELGSDEPVVGVDAREHEVRLARIRLGSGGAKCFRERLACLGDLLAPRAAASVARSDAPPAASAAQLTLKGSSTTARWATSASSATAYPSRKPASPKNFEKLRRTTSGRPASTSATRGALPSSGR